MITKTTLALVTTIAAATSAHAEGLSFNANAEYAIEAGNFEIGAGANYGIGNMDIFANATLLTVGVDSIDLDNVDVGAGYFLTDSTQAYAAVEFDGNMEYTDTVVGVAVSF